MSASLLGVCGIVLWFVVVGCSLSVVVCIRVKNLSSVG